MKDKIDLKVIAKSISDAYKNRKHISPIRHIIGVEDVNLAYEIQHINTQARMAEGARVVGKKIGFTSRIVQEQLGVDHPGFGVLFDDREVLNGQTISMQKLMVPMVEAEIAFVLKNDLNGSNLSSIDIINAIDYVLPVIEIIGSRFNWDIKITDTIADNASTNHFVVGHTPKLLQEVDIVHSLVQIRKNQEVVSEGVGSDCMGSPINAALWLARKMEEVGNPLRAGELIYTGAIGPVVKVEAGDEIEVEISGLGTVSVGFVH